MSRSPPAQRDMHPSLAGSQSWSETDIVKKGCLHIKESVRLSLLKLKFKSWQSRFLVLRDSWSQLEGFGETVLEIFPPSMELNLPPTLHMSSKLPVKMSFSTNSSRDLPTLFKVPLRDRCIDLRSVKYVDVYRTSGTFPHAFIVHRDDKPPMIFGAKSDLEMREWLMAIKLLADKACKHSQPSQVPQVKSLLATNQSKGQSSASNFRCFVVDVESSEVEASPPLVSKLSGQFLFCVNQTGVMKVLSRQNNTSSTNSRSKSDSETFRLEDSDGEDSGGSNGSSGGRKEICHWKVEDIRKLKSENIPGRRGCLVTLETSSCCREYPGTFRFHTMQGIELIQYVRNVASKVEEMSVMSRSSDDVQRSDRNRFRSDSSGSFEGHRRNSNIPKPPPRPLFTISSP